MRLIISVVSHNHEQMIINFGTLKLLAAMENVEVICRDNQYSKQLQKHCIENNIHYIRNEKNKGFAENNNLNFLYYSDKFGVRKGDIFLLMNPDIMLNETAFKLFMLTLSSKEHTIFTANLFLDQGFLHQDHNVRRYPTFLDFVRSFLLRDNKTVIDKKYALPSDEKLWVSGAFLAISSENYIKLQGLDESFYMYCEDIDFCKRALMLNIGIELVTDSRIVHTRSRDSRHVFSPFFYWHCISVVKFLTKKLTLLPKKTSLSACFNRKT